MKRPTIKGKGREIFFPESKLHASKTPQRRDGETPRQHCGKVTFWLPAELIRKLDSYWLKCRAEDRSATKSGVVSKALEGFLKGVH